MTIAEKKLILMIAGLTSFLLNGCMSKNQSSSVLKEVRSPSLPTPSNSNTITGNAELRTTERGFIFSKVSRAELRSMGVDAEKFGEAWRDPSGMIWGDIIKNKDDSPRSTSQMNADKYCKEIGAQLPSGYPITLNGECGFPHTDSDFERFRKYMGAKWVEGEGIPDGYKPQVLPNLPHTVKGKILGHYFWSSSTHDCGRVSGDAYIFNGSKGNLFRYWRNYSSVARCVVPFRRL